MRNGARQWGDSYVKEGRVEVVLCIVDIGEGRDWPGRRERHLGDQKAAVHRHSLDRLNTINDSLKKKGLLSSPSGPWDYLPFTAAQRLPLFTPTVQSTLDTSISDIRIYWLQAYLHQSHIVNKHISDTRFFLASSPYILYACS